MTTTKRYLIRLRSDDLIGSGSVEANDWTEALSKAILKASVDQVELTGIELIQEPEKAVDVSTYRRTCDTCGLDFKTIFPDRTTCRDCVTQSKADDKKTRGRFKTEVSDKEHLERIAACQSAPDVNQQILQELKQTNENLDTLNMQIATAMEIYRSR